MNLLGKVRQTEPWNNVYTSTFRYGVWLVFRLGFLWLYMVTGLDKFDGL